MSNSMIKADGTPCNTIRQAEQVGVPVLTVRMMYHAIMGVNRQV